MAIYVSFDDGESWQPLQTNLPHAPVYWITVQEHFNDLVIATYGRGFWILDDVTPLQQLTGQVRNANVHLFTPRAAYRFRSPTGPPAPSIDMTAGQNPPYGASIAYWLRSAPSGDVKVQILDAKGQLVRTLDGTKRAGLNRTTWDLRGEPSKPIQLRTSPEYAPEITVGAEGWRSAPEGGRLSVLMPPGTYTVKLMTGGQELTQSLTVRRDPNTTATDAAIEAQTAILADMRKDLESVADMVNSIELVRKQLADLNTALQGTANLAAVKHGALAGLAGGIEVLGGQHRLWDTLLRGYGLDGITVALVGQLHPLGVIAASVFFGALRAGANAMQVLVRVPTPLIYIVQSLTILFVVGGTAYRLQPRYDEEPPAEAKGQLVRGAERAD